MKHNPFLIIFITLSALLCMATECEEQEFVHNDCVYVNFTGCVNVKPSGEKLSGVVVEISTIYGTMFPTHKTVSCTTNNQGEFNCRVQVDTVRTKRFGMFVKIKNLDPEKYLLYIPYSYPYGNFTEKRYNHHDIGYIDFGVYKPATCTVYATDYPPYVNLPDIPGYWLILHQSFDTREIPQNKLPSYDSITTYVDTYTTAADMYTTFKLSIRILSSMKEDEIIAVDSIFCRQDEENIIRISY